jgi:protein phosphatase
VTAIRFRAGGRTDVGVHPNRTSNDDFLLIDPDLGLVAVFDAGGSWSEMGGRASRVSAEIIHRVVREGSKEEPRALIGHAFRAAGEFLRSEIDDNGWWGVSSVALALLRADSAFVSWAGDAMIHRARAEEIEPLTYPHTAWHEGVRRGFTPTNRNYRHVLLYGLGAELPAPLEILSFEPRPGDRFVLTTNGVTDHIPAATILNACRVISDPAVCAEAVIEHAIMAGSRDNCTCAVIAF